jgi:hypothetical protein
LATLLDMVRNFQRDDGSPIAFDLQELIANRFVLL